MHHMFRSRTHTKAGLLNRRNVLSLGCFGLTPLSSLESKAAVAQQTLAPRAKSVILLYMDGGPSHIDMFDLKPQAPDEIRGPVQPIASSVPGISVGEYLPHLAQQMHHVAQIRSVRHEDVPHDQAVYRVLTGYRHNIKAGGLKIEDSDLPHMGSAFNRAGQDEATMPRTIQIPEPMRIDARILPGQHAGILGARWNPFPVHVTPSGQVTPPDLKHLEQITHTRLLQRGHLLNNLQNQALFRDVNATRELASDQQQVLRILQRKSIQHAFELDREPAALRDAYGRDRHGQSTLLARRLVEAGARFVTVYWGKEIQDWGGDWKPMLVNNPWDTHRNHFPLIKNSLIPRADRTLAALLADLNERGLLDDTLVIWMGEFGRSPRISKLFSTPGREHWPHAFTLLMAGAGIRGGTVYGATDRFGEFVKDKPVSPADITATVFHSLGIDPQKTISLGNQQHRLSTGRPITGLYS